MKIRKFSHSSLLLGAVLALSGCFETVPKLTEKSLKVDDPKANSYKVGDVFESYINNGGMSVKIVMSDDSEVDAGIGSYTYKITEIDKQSNIINPTKAFTDAGDYTVAVSRINLSIATYDITVKAEDAPPTPIKELNKIEVSGQKSTYTVGDTFAFDGTVTAYYSDNTTSNVTSKSTFSGYNLENPGTQTVTVSYDGKTTSYQITVNPKPVTLEKIEISDYKTTFTVGDTFVFGGKVIAYYSDGSYFDVSDKANFSGYNLSNSGNQTVAVSFGGKTETYEITVNPEVVALDYIVIEGYKTNFTVGDTFEYGGSVTAHFNDDSSKDVTSQATFTGHNLSKPGEQIVAVSFGGETETYHIMVNPALVTLENITISGYKTTFTQYDGFSFGGTVTAHYSNNTTADVTSQATFSGYNLTFTGTQTVTVSYNGKIKTYQITISPRPVQVTQIQFTESSKSMYVGDIYNVDYTVLPNDAANKALNWTSSNTTVATVLNGTITAKSAGTATITAKSTDGSNKQASITVTVSIKTVVVTGISLDKTALTIEKGKTAQLTATISPSNATDKDIIWSGSENGITVNSKGLVSVSSTAIVGKTATIVATAHGNEEITASCVVTVKDYSGGGGASGWITDTLNIGDKVALVSKAVKQQLTSFHATGTPYGIGTAFEDEPNDSYPLTICEGAKSGTFAFETKDNKYLGYFYDENRKNSLSLNSELSDNTSWNVSFDSSGNAIITICTDSSRQILWNHATSEPRFACYSGKTGDSSYDAVQLFGLAPATPVPATSVTLTSSSLELNQGETTQLTCGFTPSNANTGKEVTWSSNSSSVTVDQTGKVTVSESAVVGSTATITVKLNSNNETATCTIKVTEKPVVQKDAWTIMIYMCGSTLEYDSEYPNSDGCASADIVEILTSNVIPSDVHILIETGGSENWELSSKYITNGKTSISSRKLQRWEVVSKKDTNSNNKLSFVEELNTNQMATQNNFESFLEWGIEKYPSENTGVIMWNHGGGIGGVCSDENYKDSDGYGNVLNTIEVAKASELALANTKADKMTFIGYDACLMGVADIASVNASYYNYMVASEESEPGNGWDYTAWLNYLYNKKANSKTNVEDILDKICSSFVYDNCDNDGCGETYWDEDYQEYYTYYCYSTLAVYDLSKMDTLISEFDSYATKIKAVSGYYNKIKTAFKSSKNYRFGEDEYGALYGNNDFIKFLDAMDAQFSSVSSTNLRNAIKALVISNHYCDKYTSIPKITPCGICCFLPEVTGDGEYGLQCYESDYTGTYATKFTVWQKICIDNGDW